MILIRELASVNNLAEGQVFTINLPLGDTYRRLFFSLEGGSGMTLAKITNLKLIIDGVIRQHFPSATVVKALNSYKNATGAVAEADDVGFTLWLMHPGMANVMQREAFGMGTLGLGNVVIQGTLGTTITTEALKVFAEVDTERRTPGTIEHVRNFTVQYAAAGNVEWDGLPKGIPAGLATLHIAHTNITSTEIQADRNILLEGSNATIARFNADGHNGTRRVNQSGYIHCDFLRDGVAEDAVNVLRISDLRVKHVLSAADTVTYTAVYMESVPFNHETALRVA